MSSAPPSPPPPPSPPAGTDLSPPAASIAAPAAVPEPASVPLPPPPVSIAEPATKDEEPLPPIQYDWLAALLSYLIPGLGQVYQGRIGKGLLFFFGLYTLFFYGMAMGKWHNVWLPDVSELPPFELAGNRIGGVPSSLYYRPQFMGQFWIGVAAWPAMMQYLNYDANKDSGPLFGTFERELPEELKPGDPPDKLTLNKLQREGNKRWDLGWVYTVIAGVLNLLVIYDALAGPMFREPPRKEVERSW